MQLSIITPEKTLFSGEVAQVTAPGSEGEFGVLPGHAPFVTTLRSGSVRVDTAQGQQNFEITGGVVEVTPEKCVILAEA